MLKNKKVAFIASGGGGKGIAHIGVLKACEDLNISFDLTIGASAGAICNAYYGTNLQADYLIDLFRENKKHSKSLSWADMFSYKKFISPRIKTGLFDLYGVEKFFFNLLETDSFSSLKIPTYISITNLNKSMGEIIGPGFNDHIPISKALAASCCVPLLFRPVKINDDFYVDGEIKRPTAVNKAFELGADTVIVSDIYKPYTQNIESSNMWNVGAQIFSMLLEDKSNRGIKIAESKFPDKQIILITPPVGNLSILNTKNWELLIDIGYKSAIDILKNLQ